MRYTPSRQYLTAGLVAAALAVVSAVFATEWVIALVGAILFLLSAFAVMLLAFRPTIEIQEQFLVVGRRAIPWVDVRRVDRTGWISPLALFVTLSTDERILLIYPGDLDAANSLLRHIRRNSREALIDGIPWIQFWGEIPAAPPVEKKELSSPRFQLLRSEDEAEVQRLFQVLKTVGHLDSRQPSDEK
ncbi:MAG TPA: hypothetical protein VFQ91_14110 [Bryobacteraceae bacterium]|nr:hypothetical protein [Bryobacteraceae bacterium]